MCTHDTASGGPDNMYLRWSEHSLVLHILEIHETSVNIYVRSTLVQSGKAGQLEAKAGRLGVGRELPGHR